MNMTSVLSKAQHIKVRSLGRFFGIALLLIILAFIVAAASVRRKQYTDFFLETVRAKLRQQQLYISLDEPSLIRKHYFSPLPLALTAKQFILSYIPNDTPLNNLNFPLTEFEIQLQLASLFFLRPTILITGKQDGGLLKLKISKSLLSSNFYISGSAENFSISRYQILNDLGITQGSLTAKIDSLVVNNNNNNNKNNRLIENGAIQSGNGSVSLTNLHKSQATSVEALSKYLPTGVMMPFPLSPWGSLELKSNIVYERGVESISNLSLSNFALSTTEGLIKGEASVTLPKWLYSFNTTISLTPKGQIALGSYLPLISGGKLTSKTVNFNAQATKISSPLGIRYTPLPNQIPASPVTTTTQDKYSF